ncbi:hypothetical protein BGX26_006032, partial [Mortierella sp. AD094]
MNASDCEQAACPIGVRIPDLKIYVLDNHSQPVPLGAVGEICIGGAGVTRGYLNRPELTAEKFPLDPFSESKGARMYKTGDLVRYLSDGNLVFLGRNDHQVKIRGFRIELGEIETRLLEHPEVRDATVIALGEGEHKRLVAYVVAETSDDLVHALRSHLTSRLPDYMVPAAYVRMDVFPLTPNGKLDRRALPEPGSDAFVSQGYEAPSGEIESSLAAIWSELLKIDRVGRHDNFFMLGGHSLLAVQMIERLRRIELDLSVRALFETPTLSVLAKSLNKRQANVKVPDNQIMPESAMITPEMLPLIDLTQADIDTIINQVPGGVSNIQDIYALSPLQDGILFHHIMATHGDPYLLVIKMSFDSRDILDRYLEAVQKVVDRHDILRTAIIWENLSVPAQVVLRHAPMSVTELSLDADDGPILDQMTKLFDPRSHRIDLTQAPLIRFAIAQDIEGRWIAVELMHHLVSDHSTANVMTSEIKALLDDHIESMVPPQPFRNLIAQTRLGSNSGTHEQFFSKMLTDIDTPALPYGFSDAFHDGVDITESHRTISQDLNIKLRSHARRMGVSLASLCHLAWAQVISKTSGQEQVVFGTVLFGRMQGGSGADQAMGLFINTLPLRVDVGETGVEESVMQTQINLAALLDHEHAPLALAQRCSSIPAGTSLFSALLNYRHNTEQPDEATSISGMQYLDKQESTNYPFVMSVDDDGNSLGLTAQVLKQHDPSLICRYMQQALQGLGDALDHTPFVPIRDLNILPREERDMLILSLNTTEASYPHDVCIHQLLENQVEQTPDTIAIVYENQTMSYRELNAKANLRAIQFKELGIQPGEFIATLLERSFELIIVQIAALKIGAAYVPIDPKAPVDRQTFIINDCGARLLVTDESTKAPEEFHPITQ